MSILYDFHMHSSFSQDSETPMEIMVRRSIDLGLKGICFTEHMDIDYPKKYFPQQAHPFEADPSAVQMEIERLRKIYSDCPDSDMIVLDRRQKEYRKKAAALSFSIGFGLEFGMQPSLSEKFHSIAQNYPLDFIVCSQHLAGQYDPYYADAWEGFETDEVIERHYKEMYSNLIRISDWDTLGHLDYIVRYIPGQSSRVYDSLTKHREIIDAILRYVICQGKCLEVNSAGYKYHLGQPNPSISILRHYMELGGRRITIGADAHAPEHIAMCFPQLEGLLMSLGFKTFIIFHRRKPREIGLGE